MNTPGLIVTPSNPHPSAGLMRAALGLSLASLLLFGLGYSLLATALGGMLFPHTATGSLIQRNGTVVGSALVAQPFTDARYFQPRPSAAGYDLMALAGSNQARSNPDLRQRLADAIAHVAARDGIDPQEVPGDLVTQSGGGIDPHISPAGARVQIARVAAARNMTIAAVEQRVAEHTQGRQFGLLGQPRVNVLALNLALDASTQARGAE